MLWAPDELVKDFVGRLGTSTACPFRFCGVDGDVRDPHGTAGVGRSGSSDHPSTAGELLAQWRSVGVPGARFAIELGLMFWLSAKTLSAS